jgi:pyruvate formate lyase activating enzyme
MKEALFYKKLDGQKVQCMLCPHNCVIPPQNSGTCGARVNEAGILDSIVYGRVSSLAIDAIEKKPLFHFYPGSLVYSMGTLGCNMKCSHCQNWQISHVLASERSFTRATEYISPETAVENALKNDCEGLAFTYNEPTVWFEYTLDTAKLAKENGLYTVYVTNGYINPEPLDMIGPYLDAFRVDIKGFGDEFYKEIAKVPSIKPVLESAVRAKKKWNMHVEAVTNIIPGKNDDPVILRGIARWIKTELGKETPWHVTRFVPCLEFLDLKATPIETLEMAQEIGCQEGLDYVYTGNVPSHRGENTYCPGCGEMVIERGGFSLMSYQIKSGRCKYCGYEININGS